MNLGMMTPRHERWSEFLDRLAGPEGCNFCERPEEHHSSTWDCDSMFARSHARSILAAMGATPAEIEQSLGYFVAFGGYCDCEILFDVQSGFNNQMGRGISRPNPRRPNPRPKPKRNIKQGKASA